MDYGYFLYGNHRYLFVCVVYGWHLVLLHGSLLYAYPGAEQRGIVSPLNKWHGRLAHYQIFLRGVQRFFPFPCLVCLILLLPFYFWIKTIEPLWPGTDPLTNM